MRRLFADLKRRGAVLVITSCGLLITRSALGGPAERQPPAKPPQRPDASALRRPQWLRSTAAALPALRRSGERRTPAERRQLLEELGERARQAGLPLPQAGGVGRLAAEGVEPPPPGPGTCTFGPLNPTLAPLHDLAAPFAFSRVTFGDVDGDGDLDLFLGDKYSLELRYLENLGTPTAPVYGERFGADNPMAGYLFGTPDDPDTVADEETSDAPAPALGDVDGDGDLDLVVGLYDGTLRYFAGGPGGTFGEQTGAANPFDAIGVTGFAAPAFGDLDGDGDLDLSVGSKYGGISTFRNDGGVFVDISATDPFPADAFDDPTQGAYFLAPYYADIDGDGDLDAFVGGVGSYSGYPLGGVVRFFENLDADLPPVDGLPVPFVEQTGRESLVDLGNPFDALERMLPGPALVDIDGDGDQDAFLGGKIGTIGFYENTGTAADPAFLDNGFGLTFVDIDADGDQDAFATATEMVEEALAFADDILFYRNEGTPAAPRWELQPASPFTFVPESAPPGFVTFGDMDGDGDMDAFIGSYYGYVQYWPNEGTAAVPAFPAPAAFPDVTGETFTYLPKPELADIDGDLDLDLLVGSGDGTIRYFSNDPGAGPGGRALVEQTGVDNPFDAIDIACGCSGGEFVSPFVVDFDLDGDLDLFVGDKIGQVSYYENQGTALAPAFVQNDLENPFFETFVSLFATPALANLDGDPAVEGFHAGLQAAEAYDQVTPAILVSPPAVVTSETGTTATFDVLLASAPDGPVTVGVASSDLTEGTVGTTTLNFDPTNWSVPQQVVVTGVDDALLDGPIPYTIVLTNGTGAGCYAGVDAPDVAAVNLDNETGDARKAVSGGTLQAGGTVQYTVQITNPGPSPRPDGAGPEFQDVLPAQLELVSATADLGTATVDLGTDTVTWNGALAVGQTVTLTIAATIDAAAAGQTISNQGQVLDTDGVGAPDAPQPTDDPATAPLGDPTAFIAAPGATAEIPTLSELAAALMAALLGLFGWATLRRH